MRQRALFETDGQLLVFARRFGTQGIEKLPPAIGQADDAGRDRSAVDVHVKDRQKNPDEQCRAPYEFVELDLFDVHYLAVGR